METNTMTAAPAATTSIRGNATARRLKRLADEMAELLTDHAAGEFFLQVYPAGHQKGIALFCIDSPAMSIPLTDYPITPFAGIDLHSYKTVAEGLRKLEGDVSDLSRVANILDDYTHQVLERGRFSQDGVVEHSLSEDTGQNIQHLTLILKTQAASLHRRYSAAARYPQDEEALS